MAARIIYNGLDDINGRQRNSVISNNYIVYLQSEIFYKRHAIRHSNILTQMTSDKPDLSRAWKRTFWQVYDNLGLIFAATIIWVLFSLTVILFPAVTAALFYIAYQIIIDKPVNIKDFFMAMQRYAFKGTIVACTLAGLILLFLININICIKYFGTTGLLLAGINFWFLFFTLFASLYTFPLLTRNMNYLNTLKYSYLLPLVNTKISLFLAIISLLFISLELVIPIISMGILAIFTQNLLLEIEAVHNKSIKIITSRRNLKEIWRVWE